MHSLLDDAFALVSPSSQATNAGITLPGLGVRREHTALSSPPSRGPRPCGPSYSGVRYTVLKNMDASMNECPMFVLLRHIKLI